MALHSGYCARRSLDAGRMEVGQDGQTTLHPAHPG